MEWLICNLFELELNTQLSVLVFSGNLCSFCQSYEIQLFPHRYFGLLLIITQPSLFVESSVPRLPSKISVVGAVCTELSIKSYICFV